MGNGFYSKLLVYQGVSDMKEIGKKKTGTLKGSPSGAID